MSNLDRNQLTLLKRLIQDEGWDVLIRALADHIEELAKQPVTGSDAFETLREVHLKQGKIDGLTEFFSKIEQQNV